MPDIGDDVTHIKVGDHVIVPFNIASGEYISSPQRIHTNCNP